MIVSERALKGHPLKYLSGVMHIPGLPYEYSADLQAFMIIAIHNLHYISDVNYSNPDPSAHFDITNENPVSKLYSNIDRCCSRKSSSVLLRRVYKDLVRGYDYSGGDIDWSHWMDKKHYRNFVNFWDSLLPKDRKMIEKRVGNWKSAGDVSSTPDKANHLLSLHAE